MSASPAKPVGVALAGEHLRALLADRALATRLDAAPLAFAIAGIDRVDGGRPSGPTIESTIAAGTLSAYAPRLGWIAAAAVHRDHPYNLARRIASLDHVAEGRAGVLLGLDDAFAPAVRDGHEVWGGAGLSPGVPVGIATTRDAALAIRKLFHSWPATTIVADRDDRIYARADAIVHVDHRGVFDIDGPLTVPTTPQGAPVLAWRARTAQEASAAEAVVDLVLLPADALDARAAGPAARYAETADAGLAGALLADPRVAGVVLRPAPTTAALEALLDTVLPALAAAGTLAPPRGGTLRERLGLPDTPPDLTGARPAFPAAVARA
jgi:hypothetical protein